MIRLTRPCANKFRKSAFLAKRIRVFAEIAHDLKLTDAQKGAIFSAFGLAYALFEIPTGWLGDKMGARKILIRVVLWWSFFTAATG